MARVLRGLGRGHRAARQDHDGPAALGPAARRGGVGHHGGDRRPGARDACSRRAAGAARERGRGSGRDRVDGANSSPIPRSSSCATWTRIEPSTSSTPGCVPREPIGGCRCWWSSGFEGGRTGCRTIPEAVHVGVAGRVRPNDCGSPGSRATRGRLSGSIAASALALVIGVPGSAARADVDDDRRRHLRRGGPHRAVGRRERVLRRGGRPAPRSVAERRGRARRAPLRLLPDPRLGIYERLSPLPSRDGARGFQPAMELWGHVCLGRSPSSRSSGSASATSRSTSTCRSPVVIRHASGGAFDADGGLRDPFAERSARLRPRPVGPRARAGRSWWGSASATHAPRSTSGGSSRSSTTTTGSSTRSRRTSSGCASVRQMCLVR